MGEDAGHEANHFLPHQRSVEILDLVGARREFLEFAPVLRRTGDGEPIRTPIVGAGSVVVKDLPPYTVAVGNPCQVVKQRK